MARTIPEIYDEIVVEMTTFSSLDDFQANIHSSQTFLTDLSSASKVAVWRSFLWVVAFAMWVNEVLFDQHSAAVEARANELITGTANWYRDQCLIFQYGDTLQLINNKYQYGTIDTAKQIIERAAVVEGAGQVRLKVAKLNGSTPEPLLVSELTAFQSYINKIKFAGTEITIISRVSDLLKINYDIVYDPLVLDGLGESINNPGVFPVKDAILAFITDLPFNGTLNLTSLTDAIQQVEGVVDPTLTGAEAKYGALPYAVIDKEYQADAGHMAIDPAFDLDSTLNYIADV